MRFVRERGEILKYLLLTETQWRSLKKKSKAYGIAAIVSDDYTNLLRVENLRLGENLTPWIRRSGSAPVEVRTKFRVQGENTLTAHELRYFLQAARFARSAQAEVRLHAVADKIVMHVSADDQFSASVLGRNIPKLRGELRRVQQIHGSFRVTLISDSLPELCALYNLKVAEGIVMQKERATVRQPRFRREIREILVLTNISGPPLPMLESRLDFWSKGLPGFRFRHVYGQLTKRRLDAALENREWPLVVYRGHGSVADGRFCLELADGAYPLEALGADLYVHSACLAGPENLSLAQLPAQNVLTPLEYLADFDDAGLVEHLLKRYHTTGSLPAAIRAVQQRYSQFVWLAAGG